MIDILYELTNFLLIQMGSFVEHAILFVTGPIGISTEAALVVGIGYLIVDGVSQDMRALKQVIRSTNPRPIRPLLHLHWNVPELPTKIVFQRMLAFVHLRHKFPKILHLFSAGE